MCFKTSSAMLVFLGFHTQDKHFQAPNPRAFLAFWASRFRPVLYRSCRHPHPSPGKAFSEPTCPKKSPKKPPTRPVGPLLEPKLPPKTLLRNSFSGIQFGCPTFLQNNTAPQRQPRFGFGSATAASGSPPVDLVNAPSTKTSARTSAWSARGPPQYHLVACENPTQNQSIAQVADCP